MEDEKGEVDSGKRRQEVKESKLSSRISQNINNQKAQPCLI